MKAKEYCSSNTPVAGHRWFQKLVSTNSGSSYWAQSTNRLVYDGCPYLLQSGEAGDDETGRPVLWKLEVSSK